MCRLASGFRDALLKSVAFHKELSAATKLTVNKYSTARSGLKKAARRAASIWARSKPIASMSAIIPARSAPMAIELSLRPRPEVAAAEDCTPAGDGVAGGAALAAAAGPEGWDGAAGAAGVDVVERAGVSGTEVEAVVLGYGQISHPFTASTPAKALQKSYLVYHADYKALLFDLICLDLFFIFENFAYDSVSAAVRGCGTHAHVHLISFFFLFSSWRAYQSR